MIDRADTAASAAEKAAAVKADAEAKLSATLNSADLSEQASNGLSTGQGPQVFSVISMCLPGLIDG